MYEGITIVTVLTGSLFVAFSFYKGGKLYKPDPLQKTQLTYEDYEEYQSRIEDINHKILELNEFSEFIKGEMDLKHKELLFLYQMIHEKSKEIKEVKAPEKIEKVEVQLTVPQDLKTLESHKDQQEKKVNRNKMILELSEKGYKEAQIAQMLDIGLGEVKLVLHLYE